MFPDQRGSFPPYFYGTPIPSPYPQLFLPNCYPYMYGTVPGQQTIFGFPGKPEGQARPQTSNPDQLRRESEQTRPQNRPSNVTIRSEHDPNKEKAIKKPANRPATYLTERKFYLSQSLASEEEEGRRLRPRKTKKKHHHHSRNNQPKIAESTKPSTYSKQFASTVKSKDVKQHSHLNSSSPVAHLKEEQAKVEFYCSDEEAEAHAEVKATPVPPLGDYQP